MRWRGRRARTNLVRLVDMAVACYSRRKTHTQPFAFPRQIVHHGIAQTVSAVVPVVGTAVALVFVQKIVSGKISAMDAGEEKTN